MARPRLPMILTRFKVAAGRIRVGRRRECSGQSPADYEPGRFDSPTLQLGGPDNGKWLNGMPFFVQGMAHFW